MTPAALFSLHELEAVVGGLDTPIKSQRDVRAGFRAAPLTSKIGNMHISGAIAQLRTTDLAESIRFYTTKVGLTLEFQYMDFYAGIRAGSQLFHLKLVDEKGSLYRVRRQRRTLPPLP